VVEFWLGETQIGETQIADGLMTRLNEVLPHEGNGWTLKKVYTRTTTRNIG